MKSIFSYIWFDVVFFFAAFISSFFLTAISIPLAHRFGFLDKPSRIKKHNKATPYLGGAAIFVTFWSILIVGFNLVIQTNFEFFGLKHPMTIDVLRDINQFLPKLKLIFAGSLIIFLTGVIDDRMILKPWVKMAGQMVAVLFLVFSGLSISILDHLGYFGYFATFVWIMLIINAFNFIDSIDGHCGGIAFIACMVFFTVSQIITQPFVSIFVMVCAGAIFGFLPFNFSPAKTFLGDNGSMFLGYILAAVTLISSYQGDQPYYISPLLPIFVFGVPLYDTISVVTARLYRGQKPWVGDRNHFAHRLRKLGMIDRDATFFSYLVAVTTGLIAILSTQTTTRLGSFVLFTLFGAILIIIACLEYYSATQRKKLFL